MVKLGKLFRGLASPDALDWSADASEKVFKLAETLNKDEIKKLAPIVSRGSTLLDVLNSPLGEFAESTIPFLKVGTGLLKLYLEATKQEPTLEQQVAIVAQTAYLESFRAQLRNLPQREAILKQVGKKSPGDVLQRELKQLEAIDLSLEEAQQALVQFETSKLAAAFNQVLVVRLQDLGLKKESSIQFAQKVSAETHRYLRSSVAELGETVKRVRDWYTLDRPIYERYWNLECYLDKEIRSKPDEPIFPDEKISLRELYVPLKAKLLDREGNPIENQEPIVLENWVLDWLEDSAKQHSVVFLQGGAGLGKSVFCKMMSDRLANPSSLSRFTPVLVRLRRLERLAYNLTETLEKYLQNWAFAQDGWLKDSNYRFLFLLDGFDELLLQGREGGGLKEFLQQVSGFQQQSDRHRCLVTGRPLSLQGIDRLITQDKCLERLRLEPMEDGIRNAWLARWAAKAGKTETQQFWQFLQACPEEVKNKLAREPLLLYLLARMHREGKLKAEMFAAEQEAIQAKIKIYDTAVNWVLEKQRQDENFRLTGLETADLRSFMSEIALCVVQSGHEFAKLSMLKSRLSSHPRLENYIKRSLQATEIKQDDRALNNLMTSFYLQPHGDDRQGSVEFVHRSFGEFLFAERLKEAIEDWSKPGNRRGDLYLVEDKKLWEEIYDLLGYGGLSVELVDYLFAMLENGKEVDWVRLFKRLEDFYFRWSDGEFIDAPSEFLPQNFPQQKMLTMRTQLGELKPNLGLRQVDIYTGLNVMILLFSLHRYAQTAEDKTLKQSIHFHPCGYFTDSKQSEHQDNLQFDEFRLLRIVGYSDCVSVSEFTSIVGEFLGSANLNNADLKSANLFSANLFNANLSSANLSSANLICTDLFNTNLFNTNLFNANLSGANLFNANLSGANLGSASLIYANLSGASLGSANLENVRWNEETTWEGVRGWRTAENLPEALRQQLEEMEQRQQEGEATEP